MKRFLETASFNSRSPDLWNFGPALQAVREREALFPPTIHEVAGGKTWWLYCILVEGTHGGGVPVKAEGCNTLRHDGAHLSETETYNALTQQVREAVKGHAKSMEILKQLWSTNKSTPLSPLSGQKLGAETTPTRSRPLHSHTQLQSHRQSQFQFGGLLNTTASIRPWTPDNNRWVE